MTQNFSYFIDFDIKNNFYVYPVDVNVIAN